ncbi:MAG: hypothetical protein AAB414_05600 [Patescibacteria group bacterium]
MNQTEFKQFIKVLRFVLENKYSSFYRDKYKQKISLKSISFPADFKKIPFLIKEEIIRIDPYRRFFENPQKIRRISMTSGTTGSNIPFVSFRPEGSSFIRRFKKMPFKNILHLGPVFSGSFLNFSQILGEKTSTLPILGDINNLERTAKMAKLVKIEALQTSPTILYFFIPYLRKEHSLKKIKHIRLGGEYCSEARYTLFKKLFPNAQFDFSYAGDGMGLRGYRCQFLSKNYQPKFFHPSHHLYMEVLREENELVVTSLITNTGFPHIRYKTGDSVLITDFECRCGSKKLMEVFGKINFDVIRISGTTIYASEVEKALQPVKTYVDDDFQLHVYEAILDDKIRPKLELKLKLKKGVLEEKLLRAILVREISSHLYLSVTLTLEDLVKKGIFLPLELTFVDSFPFSPKKKHLILHVS